MKKHALLTTLLSFLLVLGVNNANAQWLNPAYTGNSNDGLGNTLNNYLEEDYISCYYKNATGPDKFIFGGSKIDGTPGNNQNLVYIITQDVGSTTQNRLGPFEVNPANSHHDKIEIQEMTVQGDYLYVLLSLWQNNGTYPDEFYSYGVLKIDLGSTNPIQNGNYQEIYPTYDGCVKMTDLAFRVMPSGRILVGYNIEPNPGYGVPCTPEGIQVDLIDPNLTSVQAATSTYYNPNSNSIDFKSIEFNPSTGNFFIIARDGQSSPVSENLIIMEMDLSSGIFPVPIANTQNLYFSNAPSITFDTIHTAIDVHSNTIYAGLKRGYQNYYMVAADFNTMNFGSREIDINGCAGYDPTAIRIDHASNAVQIAGLSRNCSNNTLSDQPVIHKMPLFPNWSGLTTLNGELLFGTSQASLITPGSQNSDFQFSDFIINPGNQDRYLYGYAVISGATGFDIGKYDVKIYNFDSPECSVSLNQVTSDVLFREVNDKNFYLDYDPPENLQEWDPPVIDYVINQTARYLYCGGGGSSTPFKKDPTTSNNLINEVDKRDRYEVKIYDLMGRNVLNFTTAELSSKKDIKVKVKRKVRNELSSSQVLIIKAKGKTTNESITYKEVFIQ